MFEHLTPEEAANLQVAISGAIAGAFLLLTALAIAAGRRVLKYVSTLTGIAQTAETERAADAAITTGMRAAEERARKFLTGLIADGPRTGDEKREVAKQVARSLAPAALAHVDEEQLDVIIDAKVQDLRAPPAPRPSTPPGTVYRPSLPPSPRLPSVTGLPEPQPARATPVPPGRRRT